MELFILVIMYSILIQENADLYLQDCLNIIEIRYDIIKNTYKLKNNNNDLFIKVTKPTVILY